MVWPWINRLGKRRETLSLFVQSAEEIEEFMDKLDRKINEERAEKKLLANQKEIYKA